MLGKNSKPVIEILTGSRLAGVVSNSRSKFESKTQSPQGIKSFDFGGVGLGIVAALDRRVEIPANKAFVSRNLSRSDPIPITPPKNSSRNRIDFDEIEMGSSEDYTIVTCHGPNNSCTKVVYCDGTRGDDRTPFRIQSTSIKSNNRGNIFDISPVNFEATGVLATDFLSSCDLCRKKLHGKDIYMYRGEKAFCSTECRYRQIVVDERKEKCSSEASRSVDVSSSPYTNGQFFSDGIMAI